MAKGFVEDTYTQERLILIRKLTKNLKVLRSATDLSQRELAIKVGISRLTYCNFEAQKRLPSWSSYLALMFFFDCHQTTHKMLRQLQIYPSSYITEINQGVERGY